MAKSDSKTQNKDKHDKVHVAGLKGGQRVQMMEAESPSLATENQEGASKKAKTSRVRGKKYLGIRSQVNRDTLYSLPEAITLLKKVSYSSFDGTVELHLVVKKDGMSVTLDLPHATGKQKVVEVASEKTIEKLKSGKVDFDVLLSTAEMMPKLVAFARILGPKGMMPNPKNGTLIKSEADASKFSTSSMTIKTEKKAPLIHTVCGKISMKDSDLQENIEAIFASLGQRQVIKAYLTASMSPSIKLQVN
jgi:large subunit ribosomal protein L1